MNDRIFFGFVYAHAQKCNHLLKRNNCSFTLANFVPKHNPVHEDEIQHLRHFINNSSKLLVLTGAGISTESGIPDYRSAEVGLYARKNHKPILYQEFVKSAKCRQRYWCRNYVGWDRFSRCLPNSSHMAVRNLEINCGKVSTVVTQNVDNLHQKAGSRNVVELHGTAYRVICLTCKALFDRSYIQEKLANLNPNFSATSLMIRPDGDVEIHEDHIKEFEPPPCDHCGGDLKPDIVFFGDNVPKERVLAIKEAVTESDSLLILGSSISVFSGYRIVLQAIEENKKVAIVNIGPTRADNLVQLKISTRCGDILPRIY